MRLLVDTNIFLDILLKRDNLYEGSKEFFYSAHANRDQTVVNAASLKDIYYFVMKGLHDKKEAVRVVFKVHNTVCKVIDCSADDAINAIFEDGDFEDNVLRQSSLRNMCDAIITRNKKDFHKNDMPCFTPEEYMRIRT